MQDEEQNFFHNRRIVVLGAGYVGAAVLASLQGSGARLAALTRNTATAESLRTAGVPCHCADLASDDWHGLFPEGADLVLNCVGSGAPDLASYRRSYVDGMASVLRWSARAPVGTLVYTSSVSVYAVDDGSRVSESSPVVTEPGNASLLLEAERRLLQAAQGPQRRFVLRLAGIYGPGRHRFLDQLVAGGAVPGVGERHLNLIHLEDIVSAVRRVWQAPDSVGSQVFNVVDDGAATRAEIAAWLASRLGVPAPTFTGEPATGRRRMTPDRLISNQALKDVLGWRPLWPSFREGYGALLSKQAL